jgi:DNA-binding CsgD family transcriptional regulator
MLKCLACGGALSAMNAYEGALRCTRCTSMNRPFDVAHLRALQMSEALHVSRAADLAVGLTAAELDVLRAAAVGHSTASTSIVLSVGAETVKAHRKRILQRLRARNATHAVAIAVKAGLIG